MVGSAFALKNWWQKTSSTPKTDAPVSEELLQLFRLRQAHSLLRVRINGQPEIFQSLLLDIDLENEILVLDEPFPNQWPIVSWLNRRVTVDTMDPGLQTRFETHVAAIDDGERPSLRLAIPYTVGREQRRKYFRLAVDGSVPVKALIRDRELGNLAAKVMDLSTRGIRLQVSGHYPELDQNFPLTIGLDRQPSFNCELAVRNFKLHHAPDQVTTVGGMLTEITPADQRMIDRFLLQIQRAQRRMAVADSEV